MTASDIENMSLIMEEEIVNFISSIRDHESVKKLSIDDNDMSSAHV
jgi:hypothetical protein